MSLSAHWHGNCPVCDEQEAEIAHLRAERDVLRRRVERLEKYTNHTPDCGLMLLSTVTGLPSTEHCTCGLAAALRGGGMG